MASTSSPLEVSTESDMALKVIITILHVIAVSSAIYRFCYRKWTYRLWWDDFVTLFSAIIDCMFFALLWLSAANGNSAVNSTYGKRVRYWFINITAIIIVWSNNISFILGLARVFQFEKQTRRTCIYLAFLFVILCVSILIHVSVLCHNESKWVQFEKKYYCAQSEAYRIYFAMLYTTADSILIAIPMFHLWQGSPSRNGARLLRSGLCASVVGLMVDITYVVFLFAPVTWEPAASTLRVRTGHLEASLSLIMSDAFFFTTLLYRYCRSEDIEASEEDTHISLTDVEIHSSDFDTSSWESTSASKPASIRNASTSKPASVRSTSTVKPASVRSTITIR